MMHQVAAVSILVQEIHIVGVTDNTARRSEPVERTMQLEIWENMLACRGSPLVKIAVEPDNIIQPAGKVFNAGKEPFNQKVVVEGYDQRLLAIFGLYTMQYEPLESLLLLGIHCLGRFIYLFIKPVHQLILENLVMKVDRAVVEYITPQDQGADCFKGGKLPGTVGFFIQGSHELHKLRVFVIFCRSELLGKTAHCRHIFRDGF